VTEENVSSVLPDYGDYAAAVAATAGLKLGDPRKTPLGDGRRAERARPHTSRANPAGPTREGGGGAASLRKGVRGPAQARA